MHALLPFALLAFTLALTVYPALIQDATACGRGKMDADASTPSRSAQDALRWVLDAKTLALSTTESSSSFSLTPTLRVSYTEGEQLPEKSRRGLKMRTLAFGEPFVQTMSDGSAQVVLVARDDLASASVVFSVHPAGEVLEVATTILYHEDVSVGAEELSLTFDGASGAGYDHALERVVVSRARSASAKGTKQLHIPNHTPRHIEVGSGERSLFIDAAGIPGVMLTAGKDNLEATFELDHREHHPLKIYNGCTDPAGLPTRWLDETPRRRGEQVTHRLLIWPGKTLGDAPLPMRYPRGYRAAIAMTDHADQGTAKRTRAFAYGAEDAGPESARGWVGRGLSYTKTVFAVDSKGYEPQLDDPAFKELYDQMIADGVEPGLHSVTGVTDERALNAREIAAFGKSYKQAAWIDHGPERNCEAITNQGWDASSKEYFLTDLLLAAGVEVWWAVLDIPVRGSRLDMLAESHAKRRAVIWLQERLRSGPAVPLMFASAWFFQARSTFLRRFSSKNLDRLIQDHGLLLAHTYLDVWATSEKFGKRTLLETRDGKVQLRDEADEVFARIQALQEEGLLLTEGVARLAPHLRESLRARILPTTDGYRITHTGKTALEAMTIRAPARKANADVFIDGVSSKDVRQTSDAGAVDVWFDLAPGQTRTLKFSGERSSKASIVITP